MFSVAYFGVSASQGFGVSAFHGFGVSASSFAASRLVRPPSSTGLTSVASCLSGSAASIFSSFARHSAAFSG